MNVALHPFRGFENQSLWEKGLSIGLPIAAITAPVLLYIKRDPFEAIALGAIECLIGISYLRKKELKPLENHLPLRKVSYLHVATACNSPDGALLHLKKGANINRKDKSGQTSLHIAAMSGSEAMIKFLLEHGANPNEVDKNGNTPLHLAAKEGRSKSTEILLDHVHDKLAQNNSGFNALHLATQYGHLRIAELLLNSDIDPNVLTESGRTPLQIAVQFGQKAMLKFLLEQAVDPNVKDKKGMTPLHVAAIVGNIDAIEILHSFKVNLDLKNSEGVTPLHLAAYCMKSGRGKVETIILLLKKGADWKLKISFKSSFFSCIGSVSRADGEAIEAAIRGQGSAKGIRFRYLDDPENPNRKYFFPIGV